VSRQQLIALLANLVFKGHLTPTEARLIVAAYDRGDLPEIEKLVALDQEQTDERWKLALLAVLLLVGGSIARPLTTSERLRARRLLPLRFEESTATLAAQVANGGISLARWQPALYAAQAGYAMQMTTGGYGAMPPLGLRDVVDAGIKAQIPFIERFGLQILAQRLIGARMSAAVIAGRSALYGGLGWGSWFKGNEERVLRPQAPGIVPRRADASTGWVVYYRARDDNRTCGPCHEAAAKGPYLPLEGPFPGDVCKGRGRCRCTRETVYDLQAWQILTGIVAPAAKPPGVGGGGNTVAVL
jgi:hypothetical protein